MAKVKKCEKCGEKLRNAGEFDTICLECYLQWEQDDRFDMNTASVPR